jgi:serine/threonine protein kinase
MNEFDEAINESSLLKYTTSENFGIITKTIKNVSSTLYSNAINISQQVNKGKVSAVFLGSMNEDFEDLRIVKKIGQGGFSEVFQAVDENTKQEFAMRLCRIDGKNFTADRAAKEINVYNQLRHLDHPNIAKIYSAKIISSYMDSEESQSLQVIMELGVCNLEEVFRHRQKQHKPWTEVEILHICSMLIDAMNVAREHGISHRDISLNNVILSNDLKNYKLIDFAEVDLAQIGENDCTRYR